MAMVPLDVIRTKVMMAIRMSGMSWPPMWSEKTWLGFGQGTVVDIRTVMYDRRKQLKMKVSERRKIHIMAFPQDTPLKARWSDDQSPMNSRQRGDLADAPPVCTTADSAIGQGLLR